eukprot:TRINITY_DN15914_c0_g1_i1.p1 TRINITY_DN15914_c0_g1~~TRINITY_DN15914_c0_g1_i1.p1  ORF type:complete len:534 (-),score=151.28 TRINITY_DN15914_c0_g1_i1:361-1962(-)
MVLGAYGHTTALVAHHAPVIVEAPWRNTMQQQSLAAEEKHRSQQPRRPKRHMSAQLSAALTRASSTGSLGRRLTQEAEPQRWAMPRDSSASSGCLFPPGQGENESGPSLRDALLFAGISKAAAAAAAPDDPLQVHREISVATDHGPLCKLRLRASSTIGEVKRLLHKATGVPAEFLRLDRGHEADEMWDEAMTVGWLAAGSTEDENRIFLSADGQSPAATALHDLLARNADAVSAARAVSPSARAPLRSHRSLRFERQAVKAVRREAGSAAPLLPEVGFELDYERAWAMPVLYQMVEVEQSYSQRTAMTFEVKGLCFRGLGLTLNPKTLKVTDVLPDGLVAKWNSLHTLAPVGVGDRLCQVNGCSDVKRMLTKELVAKQRLRLLLCRKDVMLPPPMEDWCSTPPLALGCTELVLHVAARRAPAGLQDIEEESPRLQEEAAEQLSSHAEFRLRWTTAAAPPSAMVEGDALSPSPEAGAAAASVQPQGIWTVVSVSPRPKPVRLFRPQVAPDVGIGGSSGGGGCEDAVPAPGGID